LLLAVLASEEAASSKPSKRESSEQFLFHFREGSFGYDPCFAHTYVRGKHALQTTTPFVSCQFGMHLRFTEACGKTIKLLTKMYYRRLALEVRHDEFGIQEHTWTD
jgi:hypothetical protein